MVPCTESELWLAQLVKLLFRFCYTTLVLSLNRTKTKAFGVSRPYFLNSSVFCFFLRYFPFLKMWWLILVPANIHLLSHLSLHTPWQVFFHFYYSDTQLCSPHFPGLLPHPALSPTFVKLLMLQTPLLPHSLGLFLTHWSCPDSFSASLFFCIFLCPFLLKEKTSWATFFLFCFIFFFSLYSLLSPCTVEEMKFL